MVDTKLLTFVKLYETKSFTKTAEQLYITQPSVTNHIKSLEKNHNIKVKSYNLIVHCLCEECLNKERKEKITWN